MDQRQTTDYRHLAYEIRTVARIPQSSCPSVSVSRPCGVPLFRYLSIGDAQYRCSLILSADGSIIVSFALRGLTRTTLDSVHCFMVAVVIQCRNIQCDRGATKIGGPRFPGHRVTSHQPNATRGDSPLPMSLKLRKLSCLCVGIGIKRLCGRSYADLERLWVKGVKARSCVNGFLLLVCGSCLQGLLKETLSI